MPILPWNFFANIKPYEIQNEIIKNGSKKFSHSISCPITNPLGTPIDQLG
jgi:hypothetical protein